MIAVIFVALILCGISAITILNVLSFPRLNRSEASSSPHPFVSIMIPARNEAANIKESLIRILSQDYPNYEVFLLNDNSTDNTGELARNTAAAFPNLIILQGQPVPEGWLGKNWACHQMAEIAKGEYFIFTDADVHWQPGALSTVVAHTMRTRADLLTVWPTQKTVSWSERLCVPLMALVILGYLPVLGTHYMPFSVFGAANGQCMVWRRDSYQKIGGHQGVRANVLEDVTLARRVKANRMRLRAVDGNRLISCRMYSGWESVRNGYAKNILAGYGNSIPLLIFATIFHWTVFLFPWLWLLVGWTLERHPHYPIMPLALIILGVVIRALTAAFTRQRKRDAILMPVSVLLMTRIAAQATWWQYRYGGPSWKGRIIHRERRIHG